MVLVHVKGVTLHEMAVDASVDREQIDIVCRVLAELNQHLKVCR